MQIRATTMPNTARPASRRTNRGGFTLIELLVVVAIISILMSVLLPSLNTARDAARSLQCLSLTRQMVIAQVSYAAENQNYLPGFWTSGQRIVSTNGAAAVGTKTSTTPTTSWDWISPCLGDSLELSPNRAERTWQIFDRLRCPSAREFNTEIFGTAGDRADFIEVEQRRGRFWQVSYLAPASFHMLRIPAAGGSPGNGYSHNTPFTLPASYVPRLDRVGASSKKVAVADGTRFFEYRSSGRGGIGGVLDFDVSPTTSFYSSFTSSGPIFHAANEYGRGRSGTQGSDLHLRLSMRHRGLSINAGFFDGHSETLKSERTWGDPSLWYPSGSTYSGSEATPEVQAAYEVGQAVN